VSDWQDPYCYPGTYVLKNLFNTFDPGELNRLERIYVQDRIEEGAPSGNFDLAHLQAIHRHLFQDVFEWAGELRIVEIAKNDSQFQLLRVIETGMADIHNRLLKTNFLKGLSREDFAREAAEIVSDLNFVHPFREGNGRTQLLYLKMLAKNAGHDLDLTGLSGVDWIEASRQSHSGRNERMRDAIAAAIR
jgi:cell filamentation protein